MRLRQDCKHFQIIIQNTFSILSGSSATAAIPPCSSLRNLKPLSVSSADRVRLRLHDDTVIALALALSVSSADRVRLRRSTADTCAAKSRLSVSSADRVRLRHSHRNLLYCACVLSVSSADRVRLRPSNKEDSNVQASSFQYPQRIECDCGIAHFPRIVTLLSLSVSSADRVRLRRRENGNCRNGRCSFSILSGSSATAASSLPSRSVSAATFQYPQRIECDCGCACNRQSTNK